MINLDTILENLKSVDYLFIILGLFIIIFSTWKGFIQSILGLLTWIGAILISIYFHQYLSELIVIQLSNWEFIAKNLPIENISKYILSIPLIFFLSLFLLKKFRKFLTSDLDKNFFGILMDKIFGLLFGIIFTYVILSTIIFSQTLIKFDWYENKIINPLKEKSQILKTINDINIKIKPQIENVQKD